MKNQEFKIDTKAGVVVFCQISHGKIFTSKTKVSGEDKFNIGIGQLIVMKRNEIKIRKVDIQSMFTVIEQCQKLALDNKGTTAQKLYSNFAQLTYDKIRMSRNHIKELEKDLKSLYNKTYEIKPYETIKKERKENVVKTYEVPQEIIDGTHIFDIVSGSPVLRKV